VAVEPQEGASPAPERRPSSRLRKSPAERCQSGRSGRSRKPLYPRGYRGFESPPLRHLLPPARAEIEATSRAPAEPPGTLAARRPGRRLAPKALGSISRALPRSPRRDVRAAEGARLESVYTGNRIEGSNPSLSATSPPRARVRRDPPGPRRCTPEHDARRGLARDRRSREDEGGERALRRRVRVPEILAREPECARAPAAVRQERWKLWRRFERRRSRTWNGSSTGAEEGRVRRNGTVRTWSGRERSSHKYAVPCAVGAPASLPLPPRAPVAEVACPTRRQSGP
jgi:hypothetical protein